MTRPLDELVDLEAWIAAKATTCALDLPRAARTKIAQQARLVFEAPRRLHLTAIADPADFLERHVGESLAGAALLSPAIEGALLDLGSGNGYPGVPLALSRPGLRLYLSEASARRASFLRDLAAVVLPGCTVLERHVRRASDLSDVPELVVIATRAMGGWEQIVPRLATKLVPAGQILVWAGPMMETVARRAAWRTLRMVEARALAGRDRSWVWRLAAS